MKQKSIAWADHDVLCIVIAQLVQQLGGEVELYDEDGEFSDVVFCQYDDEGERITVKVIT